MISVKVVPPRFPKSSIHCSSTLKCIAQNIHVQLTEHNKRHGRLPIIGAILSRRLASNYSTFWPIYGLKKNLYGFYYRPIKSLRNNASPSSTNSVAISHQLQLVPQNQLHRSVPFADAVTWICAVFYDFQCIHGFIARRWNVTLLSGTSAY